MRYVANFISDAEWRMSPCAKCARFARGYIGGARAHAHLSPIANAK
jgi:hypothetical protein